VDVYRASGSGVLQAGTSRVQNGDNGGKNQQPLHNSQQQQQQQKSGGSDWASSTPCTAEDVEFFRHGIKGSMGMKAEKDIARLFKGTQQVSHAEACVIGEALAAEACV
jgi:hypothetical protein